MSLHSPSDSLHFDATLPEGGTTAGIGGSTASPRNLHCGGSTAAGTAVFGFWALERYHQLYRQRYQTVPLWWKSWNRYRCWCRWFQRSEAASGTSSGTWSGTNWYRARGNREEERRPLTVCVAALKNPAVPPLVPAVVPLALVFCLQRPD